MQLNGDGTFGFCRHAVDMLGLGFCSMGGANHSKTLSYKQIATIHDAVMVAPKQSAAALRRNLMHAKGSPDKHKHIPPSQLSCTQRRVQTSRRF